MSAAAWVVGCSSDDLALSSDEQASPILPRTAELSDGPRAMAYGDGRIVTVNSGAAYVDECRSHGVPVPESVIDLDSADDWHLADEPIASLFMAPDQEDAFLWWLPSDDGLCMALPRGHVGMDATILGMICMASDGTTCYFTNELGATFDTTVGHHIGDLIGGTDLVDAPEGKCSDCHAGQNPFVIHPKDHGFKLFLESPAAAKRNPTAWPIPIVPEPFPANPEPIEHLGPVTDGQAHCDECHDGQYPIRFPLPSTEYPGYCDTVLRSAVGLTPGIENTMPPSDSGHEIEEYDDHVAWLLDACDVDPGEGVVVPYVPPHTAVPPPGVDGPYACTKKVHVTNAIYGATVKLKRNGGLVGTAVFRDAYSGLVFSLATALTTGDSLSVTQTVGATTSIPTIVVPRDHHADFPEGLPPPIITPAPLYECATAIAVLNVAGADVTISRTNPDMSTQQWVRNTALNHSWIAGIGAAFTPGTAFKVKQTLCPGPAEDASDWSAWSRVEEAPAALPDLAFDPPQPIAGQLLLKVTSIMQGSHVKISEATTPATIYDNVSVPFTNYHVITPISPLGRALALGDDLHATQMLCGVMSGDPDLPPVEVCNAATLVPEIAPPIAGDNFVLVTYAVPGSTVRVIAGGPTELGNGSSDVIGLSRDLLAGEVIFVVAELPTCTVNQAFSIVVSG